MSTQPAKAGIRAELNVDKGYPMSAKNGMTKTALGTVGSGNIFADFGLPDSGTEFAKAIIVSEIEEAIRKHALTRGKAARIMQVCQQELTMLLQGQTGPHTVERLKGLLSRLEA